MNIFIRCNLHLGKIFMYSMKSRMVMLVFFLLLGVIGFSLCSSCVKEGFEAITQWKQTGELPWDGPYSLPETQPVPEMFMFANNKVSPDCNMSTYTTSGGGVCTTPEQLRFLNSRGGNRTVEDGF